MSQCRCHSSVTFYDWGDIAGADEGMTYCIFIFQWRDTWSPVRFFSKGFQGSKTASLGIAEEGVHSIRAPGTSSVVPLDVKVVRLQWNTVRMSGLLKVTVKRCRTPNRLESLSLSEWSSFSQPWFHCKASNLCTDQICIALAPWFS